MNLVTNLLNVARSIQSASDANLLPPVETTPTDKHFVLPQVIFDSTRGYLEKIVYQINTTYEHTCYDACSVMIRHLIEILIIEIYEYNKIEYKIKNSNDEFFFLDDLVNSFLSESTWNPSRTTKRSLKSIKRLGDLSAHSRRYNATRLDIDKIINDLRVMAEDLLYLSGLKK